MPAANGVMIPCANCGKEIYRTPCRLKAAERHFCNSKCRGEWLSTQTGPNAHAYKESKAQMPCSQCGKIIRREQSKVDRNDHHFCGKSCWNAWRSIHMQREGNPNYGTGPIKTQCATCGTPIERNPARIGIEERKVHFCSKPCKYQWMSENLSGENHYFWKGGTIRYRGPNWYRQASKARKRDNYTCQHCGITEIKLGKRLDVHHIEPFRTFNYIPDENDNYKQANKLDNLISLCRNCHMTAEHGKIAIQPKLI